MHKTQSFHYTINTSAPSLPLGQLVTLMGGRGEQEQQLVALIKMAAADIIRDCCGQPLAETNMAISNQEFSQRSYSITQSQKGYLRVDLPSLLPSYWWWWWWW